MANNNQNQNQNQNQNGNNNQNQNQNGNNNQNNQTAGVGQTTGRLLNSLFSMPIKGARWVLQKANQGIDWVEQHPLGAAGIAAGGIILAKNPDKVKELGKSILGKEEPKSVNDGIVDHNVTTE